MQQEFMWEGHACTLIEPQTPSSEKYWVWRAEFLGAFDQIDQELLRRGWYIAYCNLSDRYGCPSAVADMKGFHDYIVETFHLSEKADLFGFSRGGLYAFNYAVAYPQDVATLYLDAPVLDIRSWPGGKGTGEGSPACWEECKSCYGLTEEEAADFRGNPVDHLDDLAAMGIPLLLIAGDSDKIVPYEENGKKLEDVYKKTTLPFLPVLKAGCGHHPHSVDDTAAAVEFIVNGRNAMSEKDGCC